MHHSSRFRPLAGAFDTVTHVDGAVVRDPRMLARATACHHAVVALEATVAVSSPFSKDLNASSAVRRGPD